MRHLLETARQQLIRSIWRIACAPVVHPRGAETLHGVRGHRALQRRAAGVVAAAASMAVAVALGPAPAQADLMQFKDATTAKSFGPNSAIYIDGSLTPDPFCARGINDLVYPVTDVYIVPTGQVQGKLTDAGGKGPNTIIGLASGPFLDELIAVTAPGGTLGAGVYDIVFDTCQDGFLDLEDTVFARAITVALPEVLPPVSPSIGRMKEVARQTDEVWKSAHKLLKDIYKGDKVVREFVPNWIFDAVLDLVMNQGKNYKAIADDPPDAAFQTVTTLPPVTRGAVTSVGAIPDAMAGLVSPLADEAALSGALLHALERYQGAQAAGNAEWALLHARQVRDLSATLRDHLTHTTAVDDLRSAIAGQAASVEASHAAAIGFVDRIRATGFTAGERRALRNQGRTANDIAVREAALVAVGPLPHVPAQEILDALDAVLAARLDMAEALDAGVADWNALAADLAARPGTPAQVPVARAGGPYLVGAAQAVTLDATASSTPAGTVITSIAWDLDGDGEFDDATGEHPTATFDATGSRVIAVRVTNSLGRIAVDYAQVIATGAPPPVVGSSSPDVARSAVSGLPTAAIPVGVGAQAEFSVTASSPGGDALAYAWSLDEQPVGAGSTFVYRPGASAIGEHALSVAITGGRGPGAIRIWRVIVTLLDADRDGWTATPDCDDTRTDVHPGALERLGNGIDDDCDAGTPDAPPGGLTGAVWSWGNFRGVGSGTFDDVLSPIALTALGPAVQVESTDRGGYALLADGQVRAWGNNESGEVGDGTIGLHRTPVAPLGVGGTGTLTGVTQISSETSFVAARRVDGTVVAWGSNLDGQAGDGSTIDSRTFPVQVVNADGTPLTGVRAVETGQTDVFAVMEDGTVRSWGPQRCTGSFVSEVARTAVPAPQFGARVVQLEATHGWVVTRNADGSVWTCGDLDQLGRGPRLTFEETQTPSPAIGLGPGSGVIDVAASGAAGLALKANGSVWAWGRNVNCELNALGVAPGDRLYQPTRVPLPPGPPVVDIDMDGSSHAFAVRADGSVLAWGNNIFGGGGIGSTATCIPGIQQIALGGGAAVRASSSDWNGLAMVRPLVDTAWERPAQWITAAVADAGIDEAAGGSFLVTLSEPAPYDLAVTWTLVGGASGTTVLPAGARSVAIPISVPDDTLDEDDEIVGFQLVSISHGVRIERGTAIGTIHDDDPPPALRVVATTVVEGDTSLRDVPVTIALSAPSGKDIAVRYATADATAIAPGDHDAAEGVVQIPAGQTEAVVHLAVHGDAVPEAPEAFTLVLSDPINASLAVSSATVAIVDDDPLVLDVISPTVTEGTGATTQATFLVSITPPPPGTTVTVPWSIAPGTGDVPADVAAASGVLVLDAANPRATVIAAVNGDAIAETTEAFRLALGAPTASDGRVVILGRMPPAFILDDDPVDTAPTVNAGPDLRGIEGQAIRIAGTVSDDGAVTTTWSVADPACVVADPKALATIVTCPDDTATTVTLSAEDGHHPPVTDSLALTVGNAAPVIGSVAYQRGALSVAFTDPGRADLHRCEVRWGDGAPSSTVDAVGSTCALAHAYRPGTFTATVTVRDDDGGVATRKVTIRPCAFAGFDSSVHEQPAVNLATAGQAIPVKFSLGGEFGLEIFAPGYPTSAPIACGSGAPLHEVPDMAAADAPPLSFSRSSTTYQYVWHTAQAWAGQCRRLTVRLVDGTEHTADFRFR